MTSIDQYRKAVESLKAFAESEEYTASNGNVYASGKEAFDKYTELRQQKTALLGEVARLEKMAEELKPWGDFEGDARERLVK